MIFNFFKKNLNISQHLDVINFMIVDEAEMQWNYHKECNFSKEGFRSATWSKNVITTMINQIFKMNISDEILSYVVDLGFRRGKELIDEYWQLEKEAKKLTNEKIRDKLLLAGSSIQLLAKKYPDMQHVNDRIYSEGIQSVDFVKRKSFLEFAAQFNRYIFIYVNLLDKKFKSDNKLADKFLEEGESLFAALDKEVKDKKVKDFEKEVTTLINKRNSNNLLRYKDF